MDATATPRGISLAVGELGARGRPINKQCTAVRISSTVNGDMCGTCQADLLSLSALARDARNPRLLFAPFHAAASIGSRAMEHVRLAWQSTLKPVLESVGAAASIERDQYR